MAIRDILLAVFLFGSIPFILRWAHLGVLLYIWVSVMNPHRLTWGFSYDFNYAFMIALTTLIGVVLSKEVRRPPGSTLMVVLIAFAVWTGVTTLAALHPADSYVKWIGLMKTMVMACLIPMLFHSEQRLRLLMWVVVLSIAYYGTKGGLWVLMTGGGNRVWGPADSYIADNNSIGAAIVMMIPLMRYLQLVTLQRYVRWGLTGMMLLCGVAVLGTYSRGALLAVASMVAFLWWKTRHKLALLLVAVAAIPVALWYMPEHWYTRMDTISTYQQDGSAQMRLNAWGTMFNLAKDRPVFGGGFEIASKDVYDRYSPDPAFPHQVAHSIYFEALGAHGFVGLGLFLFLYMAFWREAGALVRLSNGRPNLAWALDFGLMMQVTIVGFAVGGAFLSLINFDIPYYLIGATIAARALVDRELRGAPGAAETTRRADPVAGLRAGESTGAATRLMRCGRSRRSR